MLDNIGRCFSKILSGKYSEPKVYGDPLLTTHTRQKRKRGGLFLCPICMERYQNFLPFGLNGRRNARCPNCASLERHRFLYLYVRDVLRWTRRRLRILHIAPEECIRRCLSPLPQINYTDIDLFSANVKQKMNIIDLRFQNDHFDGIICSHVLEHVMDDHRALLELYRVIKVNGLALIMVPQDMSLKNTDEDEAVTNPKDRYLRFGHPYHVRTCGSDYADRFSEVGFEVTEIDSRSLTRQRRRLYRLNKCMIYSCKKVREGSSPATDKTA